MAEIRVRLAEALVRHRERVLDRWSADILAGPGVHYRERPATELRGWLSEGLAALIDSLRTDSPEAMVDHARRISEPRFEVGFAIDEVLDALLRLKEAVDPEIEIELADDRQARRRVRASVERHLRAAVASFGVGFAVALGEREQRLAVLEERQRLARELHDSVSQLLYAAAMYAEAAQRLLAVDQVETASRNVAQARDASVQALREMRLLIYELRPSSLAGRGLVPALRDRLEAVERRSGLRVVFSAEDAGQLSEVVEEALFGIACEALNNVVKHSGAGSVEISLVRVAGEVRISVHDDGRGFDITAADSTGGLGLTGMRERIERLGGSLEVESRPGLGCDVRAALPVAGT